MLKSKSTNKKLLNYSYHTWHNQLGKWHITFPFTYTMNYTYIIHNKPMPFQSKFTNEELITFLTTDGRSCY